MSSSKVVKAHDDALLIDGFSFQALTHGGKQRMSITAEKSSHFVPMALFDASELGSKADLLPQLQNEEAPPSPPPTPGSFVTDEDLQRYQEESYQRGLQDGKNLAERGLFNVFKGLRTAVEDLKMLREKVLRDSEDDLLALAMAVARKVIGREVAQNSQTVLRLIHAALMNLNEQDEVLIRVHPDDYALLTTSQNDALKSALLAVSFTLKPDQAVTIGSCQVETERGTVDAGFEAQLDEIYRRLLEERTTGSAEKLEAADSPAS